MNSGLQVTATSATDLIRWCSLPSGQVNPSDKSSGKAWQHEKYSTFFHSSTLQKARVTFHIDCIIVNKAPALSVDLTLAVLLWWISFSVIGLPSFLRPTKSRCFTITDIVPETVLSMLSSSLSPCVQLLSNEQRERACRDPELSYQCLRGSS